MTSLKKSSERKDVVEKIQRWIKKDYKLCLVLKINDKFTSGIPDLFIFLPFARLYIFECKREGGKRRKIQDYTVRMLRILGFNAHFVESLEEAKSIVEGRS